MNRTPVFGSYQVDAKLRPSEETFPSNQESMKRRFLYDLNCEANNSILTVG